MAWILMMKRMKMSRCIEVLVGFVKVTALGHTLSRLKSGSKCGTRWFIVNCLVLGFYLIEG